MLKELFKLQNIEVAERAVLDEKKESREFKQLKELKATFELQKENYLKMEKELASLDSQLSVFPKQIGELEERINQENKAIYDGSVSNIKELSAREAQVAALSEKLKELQSLRELYLGEYEQKHAEYEENRKKMAENYQLFEKIKTDFQKMQEVWQQNLDDLAAQKKSLIAGIAKKDVAWYESIKEKCNGTPIAMLNADHVCSGCHTIVPPVTFKRTTLGQKTFCEKCGRTLFVEEIMAEVDIKAKR